MNVAVKVMPLFLLWLLLMLVLEQGRFMSRALSLLRPCCVRLQSLVRQVASLSLCLSVCLLARDAQAKLALIVAQMLSICPCVCLRQLERSIPRREPHRLPACLSVCLSVSLSLSLFLSSYLSHMCRLISSVVDRRH